MTSRATPKPGIQDSEGKPERMTDERVLGYLNASDRGIGWILDQQREDGSFCDPGDGVGSYYKVPYALSVSGHPGEALRLADWVARHHFTRDGDFRAPERKSLEPAHDAWPVYSNAWLVMGLHRIGRFDQSLRGAEFLLRYQLPSGGFFSLDADNRFIEPVCTSWGGLAALTTGRLAEARHAADLLSRMAVEQPDPGRFYFRMDTAGNLTTDVPPGEDLSYYVDAARTAQIYYNPGISLIFLAYLHRATGESRYLEACQALFAFAERCADDAYRFPPSGKLGLGAALLYEITGADEARRAARTVADYLVETQLPDGSWILPDVGPYKALRNREGFEIRLDITAEFSIFLREIAGRVR